MKFVAKPTAALARLNGYTHTNGPIWQYDLLDWLRNEYNLHIMIIPNAENHWVYKVVTLGGFIEQEAYNVVSTYDYSTYEEALEEGIKYCLSVCKPLL